MNSSKEVLIKLFLQKLKKAIEENGLELVKRRENMKTMAKLGINIDVVEDILSNLKAESYEDGPKDDEDPLYGGTVWIFKEAIREKVIYIKIKLVHINNIDIAKCISFHFDMPPIKDNNGTGE